MNVTADAITPLELTLFQREVEQTSPLPFPPEALQQAARSTRVKHELHASAHESGKTIVCSCTLGEELLLVSGRCGVPNGPR